MTTPATPSVHFAPWVQSTAATALPLDHANIDRAHPDPPDLTPPLQFSVTVVDALASTPDPHVAKPIPAPDPAIRMLGPGDVVGLDPTVIIRRFPHPDSDGTETTYLASIEFVGTDLPWRFSPACAVDPASGAAVSRLRPWLVLIVVSGDLVVNDDAPCPYIAIPPDQLPDLDQSWAWAHAQLDGAGTDPGSGRSRLLCPQQLPKNAHVQAVLVPAFRGGVLAADPDPATRLSAATSAEAHQPAWRNPTGPVTLPVYDHWSFNTGDSLDFEALVRGIHPVAPGSLSGFGARQIDVGHPFPGDTPKPNQVIPVGSALRPLSDATDTPTVTAALQDIAATLATTISDGVTAGELAPPLRGGPHTGRPTIAPTGGDWLDEANRNPRWRLAAARGADWVVANQDRLMSQAWTQAGQIQAATQRLAIARAASAVTDSLYRRHVTPLSLDEQVTLTAPVAPRLRISPSDGPNTPAPTLQTLLSASPAPDGLASTAFGRLARTRTLLPARLSGTLISKALAGTMLDAPGLTAQAAPPAPAATQLPAAVTAFLVNTTAAAAVADQWQSRQASVHAVAAALTARFPTISATSGGGGAAVVPLPAAVANTVWSRAFAPATALQLRISSTLITADGTKANTDQLQPVLPTPLVDDALALGLIGRDPSWLIAGITGFPDESATLLRPDPAFIESVLLGANHALLDKYLWRGFPTDRRGTPVRHFWPGAQPDILPIDQWASGTVLGAHPARGAADPPPLTFLLIRSQLFQRYPDTIVVAAGAVVSGTTVTPDLTALIPQVTPMIALDARTRLMGFPIPPATITSAAPTPASPGCYFVLVEPPTGLRFGFEDTPWPHVTDAAGHLDLLTGPGPTFVDSAGFAAAAARHTVRAIMHSSRMVGAQP